MRSRNAATSSSRLRFSTKYSSSSCFGLSIGFLLIVLMGGGQAPFLQSAGTPGHQIGVDLVYIICLADALQQHDREVPSQVLAEFGQSPHQFAVPLERMRVHRQPQAPEQSQDALPVLVGKGTQ